MSSNIYLILRVTMTTITSWLRMPRTSLTFQNDWSGYKMALSVHTSRALEYIQKKIITYINKYEANVSL